MTDELTDSKEAQDREIDQALSQGHTQPSRGTPFLTQQVTPSWQEWAEDTNLSIEALLRDNKTLKIGVLAVGGIAIVAIGMTALTSKIVVKMNQGLIELGESQKQIGEILLNSGLIPIHTVTGEPINRPTPSDAKSVGIDPDAPVATAQDSGSPGEASDEQKRLMAEDGHVDMHTDKTGTGFNPKHLNTETRITAKPAE